MAEDAVDGTATPPPPVASTPLKHKVPDWSTEPKFEFFLEVLKDGALMEKLPVSDRPYYTIGRQPDVCDILLEHPTISRQHAALQYGEEGELYIIDLGSAHGTFVNKERLRHRTYHPLSVGSVIKFGQSTRLYIVLGPDEFAAREEVDPTLERMREESDARQRRKQKEKERKAAEKAREEAGCAWGFAPDAVDSDDGGDADVDPDAPDEQYRMVKSTKKRTVVKLSEAEVHEKDRQLFERLQARRHKIDNLEAENARIRAKEKEGLSEGQQRQIDRNIERIAQLQALNEQNEATIAEKNRVRAAASKSGGGARGQAKAAGYDSGEDDFFDRTTKKRRTAGAGGKKKEEEVETLATLESKYASTQTSIKELQEQLAEAEKALASAGTGAGAAAAGGGGDDVDELDAYMQGNVGSVHQDAVASLTAKLRPLMEEEKRLSALLSIARPALPGLKAVDKESEARRAAELKEQKEKEEAEGKQKKKKKKAWVPPWEKKKQAAAAAAAKATMARETKAASAAGGGGGLTAEEASAELDAALSGKTAGPRIGLGAAPVAPPTTVAQRAVEAALKEKARKLAMSMKPGLNIQKKK